MVEVLGILVIVLLVNGVHSEKDGFLFGTFPKDFKWGAATSAYQIEGAWNIDGRCDRTPEMSLSKLISCTILSLNLSFLCTYAIKIYDFHTFIVVHFCHLIYIIVIKCLSFSCTITIISIFFMSNFYCYINGRKCR